MHVIPVQVERDEAKRLVLEQLPAARCVSSRLLHHPYAGFAYRVEQAIFGKRMFGELHTMVDLCNGSAAICDAWPEPVFQPGDTHLDGPIPVLDGDAAEHQARQCVVRVLLHRRFSMHHPDVHLTKRVAPLLKPNWLMALQVHSADSAFGVLVDGLSGIYHTVSMPHPSVEAS